MFPPAVYIAVHISASPLLAASASALLVHVKDGELETAQLLVLCNSPVVTKTRSAPAGTPVSEFTVELFPYAAFDVAIVTWACKNLLEKIEKKKMKKDKMGIRP
jgi:hypothetical protein